MTVSKRSATYSVVFSVDGRRHVVDVEVPAGSNEVEARKTCLAAAAKKCGATSNFGVPVFEPSNKQSTDLAISGFYLVALHIPDGDGEGVLSDHLVELTIGLAVEAYEAAIADIARAKTCVERAFEKFNTAKPLGKTGRVLNPRRQLLDMLPDILVELGKCEEAYSKMIAGAAVELELAQARATS